MIARSRSMPLTVRPAAPEGASIKRETRGGTESAGRVATHVSDVATAAITTAPAVSVATRRNIGRRGRTVADTVLGGGARAAPLSSTNSAVEMSATRRRRALVRQL